MQKVSIMFNLKGSFLGSVVEFTIAFLTLVTVITLLIVSTIFFFHDLPNYLYDVYPMLESNSTLFLITLLVQALVIFPLQTAFLLWLLSKSVFKKELAKDKERMIYMLQGLTKKF